VAGGAGNQAIGYESTVGGGQDNQATGTGSFVGGGGTDGLTDGDTINLAGGAAATVAGGIANSAFEIYGTVCGGAFNDADGNSATVGGGYRNSASAAASTVGGGQQNSALNMYATVPGGYGNGAEGYSSFAAGYGSLANGNYSCALGCSNTVGGNYSCALGQGGTANDHNAFLWCDGTRAGISQGADTFSVLATGGIFMFSGPGGAKLAANQTTWSAISDRNAKKNFQAVDTVAVLDKLAAIPIQRWNYKWDKDSDVPHIGPMAQDFKVAFYPGRDDTGITTLEFDGVELAAIQGLNLKLEQSVKEKDARISALERRLADLEATVQKVSEQVEQSKAAPIQAANVREQGGM
jgi:hypothetical protein